MPFTVWWQENVHLNTEPKVGPQKYLYTNHNYDEALERDPSIIETIIIVITIVEAKNDGYMFFHYNTQIQTLVPKLTHVSAVQQVNLSSYLKPDDGHLKNVLWATNYIQPKH